MTIASTKIEATYTYHGPRCSECGQRNGNRRSERWEVKAHDRYGEYVWIGYGTTKRAAWRDLMRAMFKDGDQ